jgi:hypothetical protein
LHFRTYLIIVFNIFPEQRSKEREQSAHFWAIHSYSALLLFDKERLWAKFAVCSLTKSNHAQILLFNIFHKDRLWANFTLHSLTKSNRERVCSLLFDKERLWATLFDEEQKRAREQRANAHPCLKYKWLVILDALDDMLFKRKKIFF